MNIHPILVHFPIALLTIYAILEIAIPLKIKAFRLFKWDIPEVSPRFEKMYQLLINPIWISIKAFLVILGTVLTFATLQTGEWAEHMYMSYATDYTAFAQSEVGQLIELHSTFATATVIIFSILAVAYLLRLVPLLVSLPQSMLAVSAKIQNIVLNVYIAPLLALLGIIAITITGALGGAIAHGSDTDPVVQMIYSLFF
ncbi:hypothetical protein KAZ66_01465 [Candidatus Woesebacteria bacterium]|nr:hypothetical protein [Candidatus Woesebacteria bacterium]